MCDYLSGAYKLLDDVRELGILTAHKDATWRLVLRICGEQIMLHAFGCFPACQKGFSVPA